MPVLKFGMDPLEINRRVKAFTYLIVSVYFSLLISSLFLLVTLVGQNFWLFISICLVLLFGLIIARIATLRFFAAYLLTEIRVYQDCVEIEYLESVRKVLTSDIKNICIKRTSRGTVRELSLWTKESGVLFLDGIKDFEKFKKAVINISGQAKIEESVENLNYDHPFFYPVLGFLLGIAAIYAIRIFIKMDFNNLNIVFYVMAFYLVGLGGYFVKIRPLYVRYGKKFKKTDFLTGLVLLFVSILLFVLFNR